MPKPIEINVRIVRKLNLGNYETLDIGLESKYVLNENEDYVEAYDVAFTELVKILEDKLGRQL